MTRSAVSDRRRAPAPRSELAGIALACAAALGAVYVLAVLTRRGQTIDSSAFGNLTPGVNLRVFDATDTLLATISIASVTLLGLAIAALALLRGRGDLAVAAGVLLIGANVTTQILKNVLPRPDLLETVFDGAGGSFPSGHVTVAMSLAMALTLVSPRGLQPLVATVGTVYAAGVGVAVLALNWHRPSDVIGAYLVSLGWAALAAMLVRPGRRDRAPSARAERAATIAATVLVVAFLGIAGAAAVSRFDLLRIVDDRTAFAVASLVAVATAAIVMALLLRALRGDRPRLAH